MSDLDLRVSDAERARTAMWPRGHPAAGRRDLGAPALGRASRRGRV